MAQKKKPRRLNDITTPEKTAAFLACVVKHGGNITAACEESDLARWAVYALEKDDPEFAEVFRAAQRQGLAVLEDEARRRAFAGTLKPVFYKGEECGAVQEYSDTLMIFLLKGGLPEKYRERVEHSGDPDAPVQHVHQLTPIISGALEKLKDK